MKKAFTLLEMLVVIGIIAILVGLGAVSYSTAQRKARDAKRQGDLSAAQQTMEQCYAVNSFKYPNTGDGSLSVSNGTITGTCPNPNSSITFTITDPLNSGTHVYSASSVTPGVDYIFSAVLETNAVPFTVSNQQ